MDSFQLILNGYFADLPSRKSNVVKIFLSSTFSGILLYFVLPARRGLKEVNEGSVLDTYEERDYLIENVYPRLRDYCLQKYGLEFQVIDLRWGITDETIASNLTSVFCVNEIRNCQTNSAGPCFAAILSHRYGSRLVPNSIIEGEFKEICKELKKCNFDLSFRPDIQNLLKACYKTDENETPNYYRLLDINSIVSGYTTADKDQQAIWSEIQDKLQEALKFAANRLFKGEQRDKYFCSVTEEEIRNGILDYSDANDRAFVLIREIEDLGKVKRSLGNNSLVRKYTEQDDKTDSLVENLKCKIKKKLASENIKEFKVKWDIEFGISKATHLEYLESFGKAFFNFAKNQIDKAALTKGYTEKLSPGDKELYQELLDHAYLCKSNAERFYGRENLLSKIQDYVLNDGNTEPLILHGQSGAGKSSLIASFVYNVDKYLSNRKDYVVLLRFLGTTRSTSTIQKTLTSVNNQLKKLFDLKTNSSSDFNVTSQMKDQLTGYLQQISKTTTPILRSKFESVGSQFKSLYESTVKNGTSKELLSKIGLANASSQTIENTIKSLSEQFMKLFSFNSDSGSDSKTVSELKDEFVELLNYIASKHPNKKLLIFFDSIDQLQNSSSIEWILTELPNTQVKVVYSTLSNYNQILQNLTLKIKEKGNFIELRHLNGVDSVKIIDNWLSKTNRKLSASQWAALVSLFKNATLYPLYVKLVFDIVSKWSSFYTPDELFLKCRDIDHCIEYYTSLLELKYGKQLVSHCLFYLTKSYNGLSENELEDILSLDDELLEEIFQYHEPPSRRFPMALWSRIRYDLNEYLTLRELDGATVVYWYHRRFIEVMQGKYVDTVNAIEQDMLIINAIHYFLGTWNSIPKPFFYSKRVQEKRHKLGSESLRNTKKQQIEYSTEDGAISYNLRRLNEFPHFVAQLKDKYLKLALLKNSIYFNYEFMNAKANTGEILSLNDFTPLVWNYYNEFENKGKMARNPIKTLIVMHFLYIQNSQILNKYQNSLIMSLLPKLYDYYNYDVELKSFIERSLRVAIEKQHCYLVPIYNFLPSLVENANQQSMLLYDNDKVESIFSYKNQIFISCSSSKVYVHDHDKLLSTVQLANVTLMFAKICFTLFEVADMHHGSVVVGYERSLYFIELIDNLTTYTTKRVDLEDEVQTLTRLNQDHFMIQYFESVQVMEFKTQKNVVSKSFGKRITNVVLNVNNQYVQDNVSHAQCLIIVLFDNFELDILNYHENELEVAFSLPRPKFSNCLGVILDEASSTETAVRFCMLFEKASFFIFDVNLTAKSYDVRNVKIRFGDNFVALEMNMAKLLDFIDDVLLFKAGRYLYLLNLKLNKLLWISKECSFAKLLSRHSIIIFYFDRIYIEKLSDYESSDLMYQCVQIRHHNTLCSVNSRQQMLLTSSGELIGVCEDKSIKKFNLNFSFSENTEKTNLSSLYHGFLVNVDDEHVAFKVSKNKIVIVSVHNQQIVQTLMTTDEIKELISHESVLVIVSCKKNSSFVGHLFTTSVFLKKQTDSRKDLEFVFQYKFTTSTQNASVNQVKLSFRGSEFLIYAHDHKENAIVVYFNKIAPNECNLELMKKIKVEELKSVLNEKTLSRNFLFTQFKNFVILISHSAVYYLNHETNTIEREFKFEKEIDSLDTNPVQETDDLLAFDKSKHQLFYIDFESNKIIDAQNLERIQLCGQMIFVWNSKTSLITAHTASKIKKTGKFDSKQLERTYTDVDSVIIQTCSSYIALFEKPRSLSLYRIEKGAKIKNIANVPIHGEVKEMLVTRSFLTLRLKNYNIISLKIFNSNDDEREYLKIIEANISKTPKRYLEDDLHTLIEQLNPHRTIIAPIAQYDPNIFEKNQVNSRFISNLRNKIQTREFLTFFKVQAHRSANLEDGWS